MLKLFLVLFFVGTSFIQTIHADNCSQQYDTFQSCVRTQMKEDGKDPTVSEHGRQIVENEMRSCCIDHGCQDPYPSTKEGQVREECFKQVNGEVRRDLQWCVQAQAPQFQLPSDDNDKDAYWNYLLLRTYAAVRNIGDNGYNPNGQNKQKWQQAAGNQPANDVCGNDDNKKWRVSQCLINNGTFNHTADNSNWHKNSCTIKRECNGVSQQCQQEWDNIYKPSMCQCVKTLSTNGTLKNIQNNYIQCLKNHQINVHDETNDDGRLVVTKFLIGWCPSGNSSRSKFTQADPCANSKKGQPEESTTMSSQFQTPTTNGPSQNSTKVGTSTTHQSNTSIRPMMMSNPIEGILGNGPDIFSTLGNGAGFFNGLKGTSSFFGGGSNFFNGASSLFGGGPFSTLFGGGGGSPFGGFFGGNSPFGGMGSLGGAGLFKNFLSGGSGLNSAFGGGGGGLLSSLSGLNILGALTNFGKK